VPSVNYGTGAYKRTNGNFPPLTLVNMFLEQSKTSENQVALISREGLSQSYTAGSGPINGIFSKKGCFSGDKFTVSNNTLYRNTTSLGAITGSGPVSIDGSDNEVVVTRGGTAYSYNGTNLAAIAFPDSANVRAVCFINGRFVFARDATAKFYWSSILDGRTVGALNFATAERQPDQLLDVIARGDILWLMGQSTVEAWSNDGSTADLPFSRIEQVVFEVGVKATGCTVKADNTVFFIGSDDVFYRVGDVPERASDHAWEEHIGASASHKLFAFKYQGHEFLAVRLATETLAYDCATRQPCELQSSQGNWIAQCGTMVGDEAYFGHSSTNEIMVFDGWDELGDEHERRFTAAVTLDEPVSLDVVRLWANAGHTDVLTGQGSSPTVEMRTSDDAGITWSDYDSDDLGLAGAYRTVPEWRCLGLFDFPGAMMEFRVTDPVPFRVSAVKANDPSGGRSR
jgi:hypothetical protein